MPHDPGSQNTFTSGTYILAFDSFTANTRPVRKPKIRALTKPDQEGADVADDGILSAKATASAIRFFEDKDDFDAFVQQMQEVQASGVPGTLAVPVYTIQNLLLKDFEFALPRGALYRGAAMFVCDVRLFFEAV